MIGLAAEAFWGRPGPSAFLRAISDEALSSGVACASIPSRRPPSLVEALAARLRDDGFGAVFRVGGTGDRRSLVHRLAASAGISGGALRTVESLVGAPEVDAAVFLVEDVDPADRHSWASLLRTFVAERRRLATPLLPGIVVLSPADAPRDEMSGRRGADLRWKGRVTSSDMRGLVDSLRDAQGHPTLARRLAVDAIVELSGSDPALAAALSQSPDEDLLAPVAVLSALAEGLAPVEPTWGNGLHDEIEGEPHEHSLSLAAHADWKALERRAWRSHARVFTPFVEDVLGRFRTKYGGFISDALPITLTAATGPVTYADARDLELPGLRHVLKSVCSVEESVFLRTMHHARNHVAHHRTVPTDVLSALSAAWEAIRAEGAARSYWSWPRCGQSLVMRFGGPPGRAAGVLSPRRDVLEAGDLFTGPPRSAALKATADAICDLFADGQPAVVAADKLTHDERVTLVIGIPCDFEVRYEIGPFEHSPEPADIQSLLSGDGHADITVEDRRGRREAREPA